MSTPTGMRPHPVEAILTRPEKRFEVRLTRAARSLLLLPLDELESEAGPLDLSEVEESLATLLGTIRDSPDLFARRKPEVRGSISVITAFWKNFCNIPPFCGPTEEAYDRSGRSR